MEILASSPNYRKSKFFYHLNLRINLKCRKMKSWCKIWRKKPPLHWKIKHFRFSFIHNLKSPFQSWDLSVHPTRLISAWLKDVQKRRKVSPTLIKLKDNWTKRFLLVYLQNPSLSIQNSFFPLKTCLRITHWHEEHLETSV